MNSKKLYIYSMFLLNLPPKTNNIPFTTEWHLHIDSYMTESNYLESAVPKFFKTGGVHHNFDHYLRDTPGLAQFHGNEPVEHASMYWHTNDNIENELTVKAKELLAQLELTNFMGYVECELVQEAAYNNSNPKIVKAKLRGERYPGVLKNSVVYLETHITVPVSFLDSNRELFRNLNLKGVSLDKRDGIKYAVMTGLYESSEYAMQVFEYLYSLKTGFALKFEQKFYFLSELTQSPKVEFIKITHAND